MTLPRFDITPYLSMTEGQHFDRKSLFDGPPGSKKPRNRKDVRDQIAEHVAGFANAEGGVLIMGIENDGAVTGHAYPADAANEMLRVPSSRLQPPLDDGFRHSHDGKELLVFEVASADAPVMVTGNGYPWRIGDSTVKAEEPKIRASKLEGLAESWVNRPSSATIADLDQELLARAKSGAGYPELSDTDFLLKRKLADRKGRGIALRRAAELLFAREPDHPNAGIRVFRVVGSERRSGAQYNVEERPRLEGPLPRILDDAFIAIRALLRTPARLRGTRFVHTREYPDFAWREAILNAVAHRDYGNLGRSIEVTLFDDRMEVTSPGVLLPEISIDALRARERVHQSRNPRIVRVLVDLGYMRDQGEGIPRVYAEMEGAFLPEPELESSGTSFHVSFRNTPTFTPDDLAFISSVGTEELSDHEFRALLEAFRHGRVDNAEMRRITGLDTLGASKLLRVLRDRGLLVLHAAGASSYFELSDRLKSARPHAAFDGLGAELTSVGGELASDRGKLASDGGELASDGGELGSGGKTLTPEGRQLVRELGNKPRKGKLRAVIATLLADAWWTPRALANVLGRDVGSLVEDHLAPMVKEQVLERRYPDQPNHPQQAYRATYGPLFSSTVKDDE